MSFNKITALQPGAQALMDKLGRFGSSGNDLSVVMLFVASAAANFSTRNVFVIGALGGTQAAVTYLSKSSKMAPMLNTYLPLGLSGRAVAASAVLTNHLMSTKFNFKSVSLIAISSVVGLAHFATPRRDLASYGISVLTGFVLGSVASLFVEEKD